MPLRRLRSSSAIILALASIGASSAAAQVAARESSPSLVSARKSESTAARWSLFVPGSGHIYAGETGKGVALLSTAALGTALFVFSLEHDEGCDMDVCDVREANPAGIAVGAAAVVGSWAYGLIDSRRAARRHNQRLGESRRVTPFVAASASRTRLGVSITH